MIQNLFEVFVGMESSKLKYEELKIFLLKYDLMIIYFTIKNISIAKKEKKHH